MKILIISDSHGRLTNVSDVLEKVKPIDLLIHLGDVEGDEEVIPLLAECPVEMVAGNNDYFSTCEREKIIMIGQYKVLLTHGHKYGVYFGTEKLKDVARKNNIDIVMYGHTHCPTIERKEDVVILNPGSISYPRQEGRKPSYIIMELDREGNFHFNMKYLKE